MVVIQYEEFRRMVELKLVPGVNDLETFCKQNNREYLLREWDYDKNDILPSQISKGSSQKVWWKCSKGHSYLCSNANKTNGKGCPYCSGQKVLAGYNDLQSQYPELAKEFDIQRNKILPSQVSPGSNNKFWWVCPKGHSFEQSMAHRAKRGQGCPYCSNYKVLKGFNDLQTLRPDLAQEFDVEKNGVQPDEIVAGSNQKFWWKCSVCGNEWEAVVSSRLQGRGCPSCGRLKLSKARKQNSIKNGNTLVNKYPELAEEFDIEKNGVLPDEIAPGSNQKVWWRCSVCGNEWEAVVSSRTKNGNGCPVCGIKKRAEQQRKNASQSGNSLATLYPELASEFDVNKNNFLPSEVSPGSGMMVWWVCSDCGNEYQAIIYDRTKNGNGCPNCRYNKAADTRTKQLMQSGNTLADKYPELAKEFDIEKNGIYPNEVAAGSGKKVWWKCKNGHSFQAVIYNRTVRGDGCPYCSGRYAIPGETDLKTNYPDIAKEWDYEKNGDLTPDMVLPISGKKVWWECPQGHHYQMYVAKRTAQGCGCPYCSGKKVLVGYNDLETTNPDVAKQWDYEKNGDLTPQNVTKGSQKKVWWVCSRGHHYCAPVCRRTGQGSGCQICAALRGASTPEKLAYHYLNLAFGDKYQIIPNDRNALENGTELDIYIPKLKIGVEYDGAHFHDKNEARKELRKNKLCKEKGIDLIRIRERGLSNMEDDCYCIMRDNNNSMSDMDECISAMLDYILTTTGIDIPYDIYSIGGDDDFINCKRDKQVAIDLRDNM